MKKLRLTHGLCAIVDDEDAALVSPYHWEAHKDGRNFYAKARINGKYVRLHRLIMNPSPSQIVDHINMDGLDCRRENLRLADHSLNGANRRKNRSHKLLTSFYKGVCWKQNRWHAKVVIKGKHIHIGVFRSEISAARAYDRAATQYFGEFARLNFPEARHD